MRIRVERIEEGDPWGEIFVTYRLVERDGSVCVCWLPGLEPDEEPLDFGGFEQRTDAEAFKLGIDRERALFGLIPESVEDIDLERAELDMSSNINRENRRKTEPMDDEPQLDFGAVLEAVSEPVVEHRRRRPAA